MTNELPNGPPLSPNPYAPVGTQNERVIERGSVGSKRYGTVFVGSILLFLGSLAASVAANVDIESIVFSGPALSGVACVVLVFAWPTLLRPMLVPAFAMILISVGCFLVIALNPWSPREAQKPIGYATVPLSLLLQFGWLALWQVHRAVRREWAPREGEETANASKSDPVVEPSPYSDSFQES